MLKERGAEITPVKGWTKAPTVIEGAARHLQGPEPDPQVVEGKEWTVTAGYSLLWGQRHFSAVSEVCCLPGAQILGALQQL